MKMRVLLIALVVSAMPAFAAEPVVLSGDVAVRTELGGVTVVLDTDRDGFPDHKYRLRMTEIPFDDPVEFFFENAQVTHAKDALYVAATDEPTSLAFTLDAATGVPQGVTRRVVGISLSHESGDVPPDGARAVQCAEGVSCSSSCAGYSSSVTCSAGYYASCSCTRCQCYRSTSTQSENSLVHE